jgi:hypothetical protein
MDKPRSTDGVQRHNAGHQVSRARQLAYRVEGVLEAWKHAGISLRLSRHTESARIVHVESVMLECYVHVKSDR